MIKINIYQNLHINTDRPFMGPFAIKRNVKKKKKKSKDAWMDPESVIQSEVSQKEKNKYCVLMHAYGI